MREIRLLRSRWRGLETESRLELHGHERGNPGYRQGLNLTDHRASPRPYRHASLDSFAALRRLVEFCVTAHNEVMPHWAFQGQTPDEVFFGIGDEITKRLSEARESARGKRMDVNRAVRCGVCVGETTSGALLLQRPRSRMS